MGLLLEGSHEVNEEQLKAIEATMDKAMRNIFATVAMHALLSVEANHGHPHQVIVMAFDYADAMVEEMNKRTTSTSTPSQ